MVTDASQAFMEAFRNNDSPEERQQALEESSEYNTDSNSNDSGSSGSMDPTKGQGVTVEEDSANSSDRHTGLFAGNTSGGGMEDADHDGVRDEADPTPDAPQTIESDEQTGTNETNMTITSGRNEASSDTTVGPGETVTDSDDDGEQEVATTPESRSDGTPNATQTDKGTVETQDPTPEDGDGSDSSKSTSPPEVVQVPQYIPIPAPMQTEGQDAQTGEPAQGVPVGMAALGLVAVGIAYYYAGGA